MLPFISKAGRVLLIFTLGWGLLMAGGQGPGPAWAQKKVPLKKEEKDPVVARVNDREIRLSDVYREIETLPLGDQIDVREQIDRFTNSLIAEEALFQSALTTDFDDEDLRGRVKRMVVAYLIEKHVQRKIKVSDEDVRRYYKQNRDLVRGLHVRIRHIVMKARPLCEALITKAASEKDFEKLAAEHSLDKSSAAKGGDVGFLMPVQGPLGFEPQLFKMSVGEMRVFDSAEGCHLVRITEFYDPPDPSFEQIGKTVRPILEREREQELLEALLSRARREVRVERFPLESN